MRNEITSTSDIDEREWDGHSEPKDVRTDMIATRTPENRGIEFHVSMRDYTQKDMEELIVEAAARVVVGNYGNSKLAKLIEDRCIALTTQAADEALASISADIIDQPITPKYPFMKADEKPCTMREFIGLTGRDYLTAYVDSAGKPTTDRRYGKTRIQHIVEMYMQRAFDQEIRQATNAAFAEINNAIRNRQEAFLEAEKSRFRDALASVTR